MGILEFLIALPLSLVSLLLVVGYAQLIMDFFKLPIPRPDYDTSFTGRARDTYTPYEKQFLNTCDRNNMLLAMGNSCAVTTNFI